jgi:hypothetical protein
MSTKAKESGLRIGVAAGRVHCTIHIGRLMGTSKFLLAGQAVDDMITAVGLTDKGQTVLSPQFVSCCGKVSGALKAWLKEASTPCVSGLFEDGYTVTALDAAGSTALEVVAAAPRGPKAGVRAESQRTGAIKKAEGGTSFGSPGMLTRGLSKKNMLMSNSAVSKKVVPDFGGCSNGGGNRSPSSPAAKKDPLMSSGESTADNTDGGFWADSKEAGCGGGGGGGGAREESEELLLQRCIPLPVLNALQAQALLQVGRNTTRTRLNLPSFAGLDGRLPGTQSLGGRAPPGDGGLAVRRARRDPALHRRVRAHPRKARRRLADRLLRVSRGEGCEGVR